jgi:polysaccharide export outer membrane protein
VFEVKVYRENDLCGIFQVSPQGTIEYPLLGSLRVENLTAVQISQLIRDKLKDGFIKEPYVMVFIKEFNSKKIHILGQVSKPGTFKYEDNMTIIEAITLAGGFTGSARPDSTVITRVEKGKESRFTLPVEKISKGLEKNFYLKPGDIIFVPETIL